jgi:heterodisulfide reductase subunit C2
MNNDAVFPARSSAQLKQSLEHAGLNVGSCYQCGRCSSGCPISPHFDLLPMEVIRLAAMGQEQILVASHTIWLCASCETCSTRCPNEIDIAKVMDTLREYTINKGYKPAEPRIATFHKNYLSNIRRFGRVYEIGMFAFYKLKTFDLFTDAKMGAKLMAKGKLHVLPPSFKGKKEVRKIYDDDKKEKRA